MTQTSPPLAEGVPWMLIARAGLVGASLAVVMGLVAAAGSALTPFVIGLVLAYLLLPPVNALSRRLPRWLAIILVYLAALAVFVSFILLVVPPLVAQVQRLVTAISQPQQWSAIVAELVRWYEQAVPPALQAPITNFLSNLLPALQSNLADVLQALGRFALNQVLGLFSVLSFVFGLFVVPIWLFYVLLDARRGRVVVNRLLHYRIRTDFWNAWHLVDRSLSAYIRGQLTLGIIIGVSSGLGMAALDLIPGIEVDYILLLAIWAGIAELVPMIGAILGAIPATLVALAIGGPISAATVLVLFTVIQFLENNVLVPRVIGESVGIHPAVLLVVIVIASQVIGFLGVLIAAPIAAIARDLYLYAYRRLSGKTPSEALHSLSRTKM